MMVFSDNGADWIWLSLYKNRKTLKYSHYNTGQGYVHFSGRTFPEFVCDPSRFPLALGEWIPFPAIDQLWHMF